MTFRRATQADGPAIAALFRRTFGVALPFLPTLYTPEEDRAHFSGPVFDACTVWVAEDGGIVGFVAWSPGEVHHLYVDVDHIGEGIGTALLGKAMSANDRLELWAFQRNTAALAFYHRHGFHVVRETDGSGNEEKEPDVRLAWKP